MVAWCTDHSISHNLGRIFTFKLSSCPISNYERLSTLPMLVLLIVLVKVFHDHFVWSPTRKPLCFVHRACLWRHEVVHHISEPISCKDTFFLLPCWIEVEISNDDRVILEFVCLGSFQEGESRFQLFFPQLYWISKRFEVRSCQNEVDWYEWLSAE